MTKLHKTVQAPARQPRALNVAPFEGFDRSASLAVQQEIIDDQLAAFTEGELKVMLSVTRATNGGQRESVALSVRVLCNGNAADVLPGRGTGLSPRTVQAACTALETAGYLRVNRRMAPDGSGLPSLFTLPLIVPGMRSPGEAISARFAGYGAGRRVRLPLLVFDRLLAELSGAELKVLLYVLRHTFCLGAADEVMPMARLVENTGLSLRHTRLAVAGLAARGLILVQHRQDAERGKLPSRFGVKVIGEAAPFSSIPAAPGTPSRAVRPPDEPAVEPARPVWLVPAIPTTAPIPAVSSAATPSVDVPLLAEPAAMLQVLGGAEPATVEPPTPISTQNDARTIQTIPQPSGRQSVPIGPRVIPASMLKDNSPVWSAVKKILSERLPYQVFVDRVASTASVGDGGTELLIAVQDEYHRWWLESKLGRHVREALTDAGYGDMRMRYLNFNGAASDPGDRR
jgi:hypothetical protein